MRVRPAKGNQIPSKMRTVIRARDNNQCQRCGLAGTEIHHRRSRRTRDQHTHCACSLILLCSDCHRHVTVAVADARLEGMAVSIHDEFPGQTPVCTFMGWVRMGCDGTVTHLP